MKRIITLFTALCLLLSLCLPALADEPAAGAGSAGPVPVKISAGTPTYKDESYSYAERGLDLSSRLRRTCGGPGFPHDGGGDDLSDGGL